MDAAIIQREFDRRQDQVNTFILEHRQAGFWQEGPLFITEKLGRRSIDLKKFEQVYPDKFNSVAKIKLTATIADTEKVLSGEEVDVMIKEMRE